MTTTTIELIDWLARQSKLAIQEDCPNAATGLEAVAQRLRELYKPDCAWTKDANDYFNTQCGGYFDLDKRNFCPNCGGVVKEST